MDAFDAGVVTFSASLSDKKDYYSTLAPKLSSVLKVYIAILTVTYTSSIVSMLVVEDTQGTVSDLTQAIQSDRKKLSSHFIQRKRVDVEHWMNEDTPFPKRDAGEFPYSLSIPYAMFYDEILTFARGLTESKDGHKGHQHGRVRLP